MSKENKEEKQSVYTTTSSQESYTPSSPQPKKASGGRKKSTREIELEKKEQDRKNRVWSYVAQTMATSDPAAAPAYFSEPANRKKAAELAKTMTPEDYESAGIISSQFAGALGLGAATIPAAVASPGAFLGSVATGAAGGYAWDKGVVKPLTGYNTTGEYISHLTGNQKLQPLYEMANLGGWWGGWLGAPLSRLASAGHRTLSRGVESLINGASRYALSYEPVMAVQTNNGVMLMAKEPSRWGRIREAWRAARRALTEAAPAETPATAPQPTTTAAPSSTLGPAPQARTGRWPLGKKIDLIKKEDLPKVVKSTQDLPAEEMPAVSYDNYKIIGETRDGFVIEQPMYEGFEVVAKHADGSFTLRDPVSGETIIENAVNPDKIILKPKQVGKDIDKTSYKFGDDVVRLGESTAQHKRITFQDGSVADHYYVSTEPQSSLSAAGYKVPTVTPIKPGEELPGSLIYGIDGTPASRLYSGMHRLNNYGVPQPNWMQRHPVAAWTLGVGTAGATLGFGLRGIGQGLKLFPEALYKGVPKTVEAHSNNTSQAQAADTSQTQPRPSTLDKLPTSIPAE